MDIKAELEALRDLCAEGYKLAPEGESKQLLEGFVDRLTAIIARLPPDAVVVRDVGEKGALKSNRFLVQPQGPWHEGWNACRRAMLQAAEESQG